MSGTLQNSWQANTDLSQLNTLAVPSAAEYFLCVQTAEALADAIQQAKAKKLSFHILSGGSNVLCQPYISGLVIQPKIQGITVEQPDTHKDKSVRLTVGAGESWHAFVDWCLTQGYYGLENLALIPGWVGAAPIQNIGAYGVEVSHFLKAVHWYDCDNARQVVYSQEQCQLGYRDSIFKRELKGRAIITHVVFELPLKPNPVLNYAPLKTLFDGKQATPRAVFDAVCQVRGQKLPDPSDIPNCGSFFKNPVISAQQFSSLQALHPKIPHYPQRTGDIKIPAAWLIDQAGLKGQWVEGLRVHVDQALVLTNPNGQGFDHVMAAEQAIIARVKEVFGVRLEAEPQIL